ncbi:WYL domain-containing protein [Paenibacillus sp. OV219]|uniref:WYL domain-containing protein n=1 Tax=Paenibacillus sp. OV219 TaxID=1884377 RepID=UPI0008AF3DB5|nr:WYL domain-containing protein [Paenibacillus sp. OV219]SEO47885.1 Predicted DNA-binding transcriptional regulator YafY, contains an HTH and WYL domains [Paenibacillus sp. OV219]
MNPFEKIFNYQVISRLEDSGTFMVTSHERAWLKLMLEHPAAEAAFATETLEKLQSILSEDVSLAVKEHLIEKTRSFEKQVYHPLLRSISRFITSPAAISLTFSLRDGRQYEAYAGVPYKLEYSMVKREWYLLWYNVRKRAFMSTKLDKIMSIAEAEMSPQRVQQALSSIRERLNKRKESAVIEVVPTYNRELSRILYAFSCFEKTVDYDEDASVYAIRLSFLSDESEYVLSKIRFLGRRIRVKEGEYLRKRMLESSRKALDRYAEAVAVDAEDSEGLAT